MREVWRGGRSNSQEGARVGIPSLEFLAYLVDVPNMTLAQQHQGQGQCDGGKRYALYQKNKEESKQVETRKPGLNYFGAGL